MANTSVVSNVILDSNINGHLKNNIILIHQKYQQEQNEVEPCQECNNEQQQPWQTTQ